MKILYIEDCEGDYEIVKYLLEHHINDGLELEWLDHIEDVQQLENYSSYDGFLIDLNLPGVGGIEAGKYIHDNFNKPTMLFTSYPSDEHLFFDFSCSKNESEEFLIKFEKFMEVILIDGR